MTYSGQDYWDDHTEFDALDWLNRAERWAYMATWYFQYLTREKLKFLWSICFWFERRAWRRMEATW